MLFVLVVSLALNYVDCYGSVPKLFQIVFIIPLCALNEEVESKRMLHITRMNTMINCSRGVSSLGLNI